MFKSLVFQIAKRLIVNALLLSSCIFSAIICQAQEINSLEVLDQEKINYHAFTAKNRWLVGFDFGMGIGVRNQNINFNNTTTIVDVNVSPKVGKLLGKGWLCGIDFDYFASVASFNSQDEYRFLLRSYNGFVRYYSPSGLLLEVASGYGDGNEKYITNGETTSIGFDGYRYAFGIGIANYWSGRISFELLLKYAGSLGNYNDTKEQFFTNGLSMNAGVSLSLGK